MRKLTLSIAAAAVLAVAVPAVALGDDPGAGKIPPPHPILTHIDKTPLIELSDGGGGLPYLGSATSYNAGDWENALRTFHDSGVYDTELAQIDKVADKSLLRFVHAGSFERSHKSRSKLHRRARTATLHGRKLAIVLDIDETSLSNYSAINADNSRSARTRRPRRSTRSASRSSRRSTCSTWPRRTAWRSSSSPAAARPCASRRPRTSRPRATPAGTA